MSETPRIITVHGYIEGSRKLDNNGNPFKPNSTSRMVALALSVLTREQRQTENPISTILFTTTAELPYAGWTMSQQVSRNLAGNFPEAAHDLRAPTTIAETQIAYQNAQFSGWGPTEMLVMGDEAHIDRIKRSHRRAFGREAYQQMQFVSAQSILTQEGMPKRYADFVTSIMSSETYTAFKQREVIYNLVDGIPFVGGIIMQTLDKLQGDNKVLANLLFKFSKDTKYFLKLIQELF